MKRLLDFETKTIYKFQVVATDSGFPKALSTYAEIVVKVLNINDNVPAFECLSYSAKIPDDAVSRHFVISLSASDRDFMNSVKYGNLQPGLKYSILAGDSSPSSFDIDKSSGVIRTARNLMLQTAVKQRFYSLNVSVTDGVFTGT